jgi:hypothetical protein
MFASSRHRLPNARISFLYKLITVTALNGITESLRKVTADLPHIIFKQRDLARPNDFVFLFLFTTERKASEPSLIGFPNMERQDLAGIAMCNSVTQIDKEPPGEAMLATESTRWVDINQPELSDPSRRR